MDAMKGKTWKGIDYMNLQESEARLRGLNEEIDRLLKEREDVLKEWNIAFGTENSEGVACVDESAGNCHNLYLVNGDSRMQVCRIGAEDMNGSRDDFYKRIDTSVKILNIANGRAYVLPDYQWNLIYAKAMEIREEFRQQL